MADYSGLGQALASAGVTYVRGMQEREALQRRRAEDQLAAETAQAKIAAGVPQQEAQAALQASQEVMMKATAEDTYRAFRGYNATGRVDFLNDGLRSNPQMQQMFGVSRVDILDPRQDARLIIENGMNPNSFLEDAPDYPQFGRRYLKATLPDGSTTIADMKAEMEATGYTRRLYGEDLALYKELMGLRKDTKNTSMQSDIQYMTGIRRQADPNVTEGEVAEELWGARISGTTPGKAAAAEEAIQEFTTSGLMDIPVHEYDNRQLSQAYAFVDRYEALSGRKPPNELMEDLRLIRTLTMFGGKVAADLSPRATGALDRLVGGVEKYTSNVPDSVRRKVQSAYTAYRNVMLRLTSGAAVTDGEAARFQQEFGDLNQRYAAVVPAFAVQLEKLKSMYEGAVASLHPAQVHLYMGMSRAQIEQAIGDINFALDVLERNKGDATEANIQRDLNVGRGGSGGTTGGSSGTSLADRIKQRKGIQ